MSRNRMGSLSQVAEPDPAEIAASLLNDRPEVQWTLVKFADGWRASGGAIWRYLG